MVDLEAKYKLAEAHYFLHGVKSLKSKPDEFMYNLSAFLSAWRSVLDVLLYDYAKKYFGWRRDARFDVRDFEIAVRVSGNGSALSFIEWYRKTIHSLSGNPLWKKRTVIVHRGRPEVTRTYYLYFVETVAVRGSLSIETSRQDIPGAIPPEEAIFVEEDEKRDDSEKSVEVFFEDCKNKEIDDICEEAFEQMEKIVNEAENTFDG